jgi:hypothetical protein
MVHRYFPLKYSLPNCTQLCLGDADLPVIVELRSPELGNLILDREPDPAVAAAPADDPVPTSQNFFHFVADGDNE